MHTHVLTGLLDELEKIGGVTGYLLFKSLKNSPMILSEKRRLEELPDRLRRYEHALRENLPAGHAEFGG